MRGEEWIVCVHSCPGGERVKAALALVCPACSLMEELLDVWLKAEQQWRGGCKCGCESFILDSSFRCQLASTAVVADLPGIHTE